MKMIKKFRTFYKTLVIFIARLSYKDKFIIRFRIRFPEMAHASEKSNWKFWIQKLTAEAQHNEHELEKLSPSKPNCSILWQYVELWLRPRPRQSLRAFHERELYSSSDLCAIYSLLFIVIQGFAEKTDVSVCCRDLLPRRPLQLCFLRWKAWRRGKTNAGKLY